MDAMTRKERIDAALKGAEVDRTPISFWRHFYLQERDAGTLADTLLGFQREFGWDFMKVNPRASYHVEDWGNRYSYTDDPHQKPTCTHYAVHSKADWAKIQPLDIWKAPVLKQQLTLLQLIKEGLQNEEVYFIQTIFSPLSVAEYLVGESKERLFAAMQNEPDELQAALDAIAETFTNYATASLQAGASGIFYTPTTLASSDFMTEEQYDRFCTPYDRRILAAIQDRPGFNLLHLCGANVFFDKLMGYPVDAISWDVAQAGNPSLGEGRKRSGKMVVGGLGQKTTLLNGTVEQVQKEVARGIAETGGRGYVVAPGCTFSTRAPRELLVAAVEAAS